MDTPRPRTLRAARLTAGLAAAALGAGSLAGLAVPAHAADTTGFPRTLTFEPSKLIATADAVYAVGFEEADDATESHGYVQKVGSGDPVDLGEGTTVADAALTDDGNLLVVGTVSDGDGTDSATWSIDTADLGQPGPAPEPTLAPSGDRVSLVDVDSAGPYTVGNDGAGQLRIWQEDDAVAVVADAAEATATASTGAVGQRTWYLAGSAWDPVTTATLWAVTEEGEDPDPVLLGAAGDDPDQYVQSMAVDPATDIAYVLTLRDNEDGPQTYGLNVVTAGEDTYVPLDYATALALSPDGDTVYLSTGYDIVALDADDVASYAEGSDVPSVYLDSDDTLTELATDPAGNVFAAGGNDVFAVAVPEAPTALAAAPDPMSTEGVTASWDEGKYAWQLEDAGGAPARYRYEIRSADDEVVDSGTTNDQIVSVSGLQPGTTYDVRVASTNGLLDSPWVEQQVTTHDRYLSAPSALAVQGSLTVGSTLSFAATGAWEAGTDVTYEWYGATESMGGQIATGPTLTLTAEHLGLTITGVATGTKAGAAGVALVARASGTVANPAQPPITAPVTPPAPKVLAAATPKISGTARVGETLVAKPGKWTAGAKLSYQWEAAGKPIKGADGRKLTLTKALKGKRIGVTVTGSLTGYATESRTSKETAKVGGAAKAGAKPGKGKGGKGGKGGKPGKGKGGKPGKGGKGHR
ncbi:fibronectin type III domain-containing protein [Nocardioides soli]|uniref:Fibronectin type-III domain-containing protein n=1 Tax=Nocardioides soli TaxID=1036020 RepID=A0A7W4Z1A7_9ACTN|nr:fibronectin type III domain-containing protein [Nocardioides soli]MBB3041330.1 hypothetical protein [Nocardioides soli]